MATSLQSGPLAIRNAYANVAAAQTDSVLVAAVATRKIRVKALIINAADVGVVTVTFNSKPAGAGTAISPAFKVALNQTVVVPEAPAYFETGAGEGLTVTTAAASACGIIVVYDLAG